MLVFLDTEFTDPLECELISVALVTEDGRYLYAELSDYDQTRCSQFVRAAVLPQLGNIPGTETSRQALPQKLRQWIQELQDTVILACDHPTDWELLDEALDGEQPSNLLGCFVLGTWLALPGWQTASTSFHEADGHTRHHALNDALAHRAGWLASGKPVPSLPAT